MIEIKQVVKKFGKKIAVNNLTTQIGSGITGLVGENGAGKSTLFRLISGVYIPNNGQITVDGYPHDSKKAKESVFFLADEPFFNLGDTPSTLYKSYATFFDVDEKKYFSLIKKFGLPKDKTLQTFSKGMRRQAFIAMSLSINVKYLLLDEAFDGLDPLVLESIKDEISQKAKTGASIVISTHNISLLDKLADQFIVLSRGRLANTKENVDQADMMIKVQLLFKKDHPIEDFQNVGIDIFQMEKIGSITHIVLLDDAELENKINQIEKPVLMERIPLSREDTIKLVMQSAKGGKQNV